jgi:plasmid stabilization system protein ParE
MKAKKIISTFAKEDLSAAVKWYESQQKGLGKRFLNEVKEAIDFISKNPTDFQIRYDDYRIYFTKIFSYGIHYKYLEDKNEIHIIAVFHTSQNPQIWGQRI